MSELDNLMPRIVVDKNAKEYVETDEEEEVIEEIMNDVEQSQDSPKEEEPEVPRVVKDLPVARKKKDIFQGVEEEEPTESEVPTKSKKKPVSKKQLEHLAKIRIKAQEAKKKKKHEKLSSAKEQKPVSAKPQEVKVKYVERKITDEDVDILIDRYKTRRKAKKEAKQAEEKARKIVQTHYETAQPAQTYRSFDDFF
jgi:hypothetical protein